MSATPAIQKALSKRAKDYLAREAQAAREHQQFLKAQMYARKAAKEKT